jgi:hypothetical protein
VVSGQTDAATVVVQTPSETARLTPTDGAFEVPVEIEHGENLITVAAATHEELSEAGTNVTRITL